MKKLLSTLLVLCLMLSAAALAEYSVGTEVQVVKCSEYVSLRETESTSSKRLAKVPLNATATVLRDEGGTFVYVNYNGADGYILRKYLSLAETASGEVVDVTLNQRMCINEFLTAFTEVDLGYYVHGVYDVFTCPQSVLCEFSINHQWFNHNDRIEYGEFVNDTNTSLYAGYTAEIVKEYFGVELSAFEAAYAEFDGSNYYWEETGGHLPEGFAIETYVEYLGDCRYRVKFAIFGAGDEWDISEVGAYSYSNAVKKFGSTDNFGCAVIYATNLNDTSTYRLERYVNR